MKTIKPLNNKTAIFCIKFKEIYLKLMIFETKIAELKIWVIVKYFTILEQLINKKLRI